ncbi:GTP-binding protein [Acidiphilium angustum]|uniref:Flagellar biosynthesis protein FlhF n=2 Tax=Acidiphilium rubrum TaxID=526 RepID=A0A8G2FLK8_ACIRU|nr:GTP-binding protein [Acidiphilium angustum]SIR19143.1 flagellar biosynthesis protein FlhF [Acidiphilium rubrum]
MRVKLIRAGSMRLALAEAHRLMGPEALILQSRSVDNDVEISVATDSEETLDHREQWGDALAFHQVPTQLAERWRNQAPDTAVASTFRFGGVGYERPLLLVGPPGAGKTMTTVKLATRLVLDGIRPTVINADQNRAGAAAQLAALCRILKAEFIDTEASDQARRRRSKSGPTLIDLPGMDPFNDTDMATLSQMIEQVSGVAALVLPAGLDVQDSADMAARFHAAGATMLIPTRLDLTRRLGGVLAAAEAAPLILSHAGTSGSVTDGLEPMTPAFLTRRLLNQNSKEAIAHAA